MNAIELALTIAVGTFVGLSAQELVWLGFIAWRRRRIAARARAEAERQMEENLVKFRAHLAASTAICHACARPLKDHEPMRMGSGLLAACPDPPTTGAGSVIFPSAPPAKGPN